MSTYGFIYQDAATSLVLSGTGYVKVNGSTEVKDASTFVSMGADARLAYTDSVARVCLIEAKLTGFITPSVGSAVDMSFAIAKNGVVDDDTEVVENMDATNEIISVVGIFSLTENDYVELWVKGADGYAYGTIQLDFDNLKLSLIGPS